MAAPFFSVILPTHLRPALLRRALESVRAQTLQDSELIVIDDAGDAQTAQVAAELLRPGDTFLRRGGRPGPAESRNAGLELARGEWTVFLDDDDAFMPQHLAAMQAQARAGGSEVLFCDCEVVTEDRSKPGTPALTRELVKLGALDVTSLWVKNAIPPHALAYRSRVLDGIRVDPYMDSVEDWEFLLAVCERALPRHCAAAGVIQHVDRVNKGNRRSTTEAATSSMVVLDYLYAYRRRPAPTPELRQRRKELLRGVGMDLPLEWF